MNSKRITTRQLEQIDTALEAVTAAARAESMQYPTIKSYTGWTRRFCEWLCNARPARWRPSTATLTNSLRIVIRNLCATPLQDVKAPLENRLN